MEGHRQEHTMHANPAAIPLVIMGVPFHRVTNTQTVDWCLEHIRQRVPGYVTTPNLDFVMHAGRDPELYRILAQSDLVIADGMPIIWLSGWLGPRLPERVAGSDLVVNLSRAAAENNLTVFNLGGAPGVPEKAGAALKARFPGFRLAGAYSPPKADLLEMDHATILGQLEASNPDILYVAFGAPKQEKWINMHVSQWKVPLALGIGGSLDFLAGTQTRAPRWMQKTGIEWLWRLGTNPSRFWKRYGANFAFLLKSAWAIHRLRQAPLHPAPAYLPPPEAAADFRIIDWRTIADDQAASRIVDTYCRAGDRRPLLVNLARCEWLDSRELGVLMTLGRHGRRHGIPVLFTGAAQRIQRWLGLNGLGQLLDAVEPGADWTALARKADAGQPQPALDAGRLRLLPPEDLTAAALQTWRSQVEHAINTMPPEVPVVEVDMTAVRFIDSAAIGFLLALKRSTESRRLRFLVTSLQPAVRTTLRIARVESVLAGSDPAGIA